MSDKVRKLLMIEDNIINIDSQEKMDSLISTLSNGELIAEKFRFTKDEYYRQLFDFLNVDMAAYQDKHYYYDESRNLHIAYSQFKYTWISTYGLISSGKITKNNYLNACINQYTVLSLLFGKALDICKDETVFNIDGFYFEYLNELAPALFHNVLFYVEVFGKAYLSLSNITIPHTHNLEKLYKDIVNTIFIKKHNDTTFHAKVILDFLRIIDYIKTIPGDFKEHFVKYDDNQGDTTVIRFDFHSLHEIYDTVNLSHDFIYSYYFDDVKDVIYLKPGLLNRLLSKSKTEEDKQKIMDMYGCLIKE